MPFLWVRVGAGLGQKVWPQAFRNDGPGPDDHKHGAISTPTKWWDEEFTRDRSANYIAMLQGPYLFCWLSDHQGNTWGRRKASGTRLVPNR
jgi:hypothetical protein